MRTIAYLEPETGRVVPPIAPQGTPYGGNGTPLVDGRQVDRLRTAAATLNEALCRVGNPPLPLIEATRQWRAAWAEVDGKHLAIGDVLPAVAEPIRSAHAFQRRR